MRGFKARCVTVVLGFWIVLFAQTAWAQDNWNANWYVEMITTGDTLYGQALEALEAGDTDTHETLLYEALAIKQDALEMLRRAVLRGEVENFEQYYDAIILDLFNLNENVIVLLMELEQCAAAELLISRALSDSSILPPTGEQHLDGLAPQIEECRERVLAAMTVVERFDEARFATLKRQSEQWFDLGMVATDDESRRSSLFEAANAASQAIDLLSEAIEADEIPDDADFEPSAELISLHDIVFTSFLEMGMCQSAERRINRALSDGARLGNDELLGHFTNRRGDLDDCEEQVARGPDEVEDPDPEPERPSTGRTNYLPFIFWGVSGVVAITAVGLDLASSGAVDELEALRGECAAGPCDYEHALELSDTLNRRKISIGVLGGIAVVTGVIGTIMYLTQSDYNFVPEGDGEGEGDGETGGETGGDVSFMPNIGLDEVGATFEITF